MRRKGRRKSNYYEDDYIRYECQSCKRSFIVGDRLSRDMTLSCPYCRSGDVEDVAAGDCDDGDMGCLGLYYSLYDDESLMLYTEQEFKDAIEEAHENRVPGERVIDGMSMYCAKRDGYIGLYE